MFIGSQESTQALQELLDFGIAPKPAAEFARTITPDTILDSIEYISHIAARKGSKICSKQSVLVYYLREGVPIPLDFLTKRQRTPQEEAERVEYERLQSMQVRRLEYEEWCKKQAEVEVEKRYSRATLKEKMAEAAAIARKELRQFDRLSTAINSEVARQIPSRNILRDMVLPSFEEWCAEIAQSVLTKLDAGVNTSSS